MHGVVMENLQPAQKWLDTHARTLRNFVCGSWLDSKSVEEQRVRLHTSTDGNTVAVQKCNSQLVHELASQVVEKSKQPVSRGDISKLLKLISAQLEQHSSLLIGLETILTGRVVRELRSLDSGSWQKVIKACIADSDVDRSSRVERGVICVRLRSTSTPLLSCLSEVASSVALGNAVLVLAESGLALTFLALLDQLRQAGAPVGALERISVLHCDADVRVPVGRGSIREVDSARVPHATAEQEAVSSRAHRGRTVAIIFEDGDLQAAANTVVDSLLLANGQHSLCTRLVYVQQPVHAKFLTLLAERCARVRVGAAADRNADVRAVESELDAQTLAFLTAPDAIRVQQSDAEPQFLVPTFVSHLPQDDTDLFACNAPICFVLPFRTPFDAVALCTQRALSVRDHNLSIFTADFSLAYELARRLPRFGAILVNTGSRMCVPSLLSLAERPHLFQLTKLRPVAEQAAPKPADSASRAHAVSDAVRACNTKLHVAGKLTFSESARLGSVKLANGEQVAVSEASATDVRMAIEAARAALNSSGWQRKAVGERATIVTQLLDHLANGASDWLGLLAATASGQSEDDASKLLSNALANLRRFTKSPSLPAARYAEEPLIAPLQAVVLRQTVPHGVLTLVLGSVGHLTLTGSTRHFVTALAAICAALLSGNAVVLIAADTHTLLAALALHRCAAVAGFNPSLLSLLTAFGDSASQTLRAAIEHHDVDATWIVAHDQDETLARFRSPKSFAYLSDELAQHLTATAECELALTLGDLVQRATTERLIALPFGSIFADV